MGAIGRRKTQVSAHQLEVEPKLQSDVSSQELAYAEYHGLYDGKRVKLDRLIKDQHNDIEIKYEAFPNDGISGKLYFKDGKWIISINQNHNQVRQRFTIAHEYGHYLMHKDLNTVFEDSVFFRNDIKDSVEYAANDFAAKLLIPEPLLRACIDNEGIKEIAQLAVIFGVSAKAMSNRVINLGYKTRNNG